MKIMNKFIIIFLTFPARGILNTQIYLRKRHSNLSETVRDTTRRVVKIKVFVKESRTGGVMYYNK